MPIIKTVAGNILDAPEKVICQQCNCCHNRVAGLASQISKKYLKLNPLANPYKNRKENSVPGTILVVDINEERTLIHMFAQFNVGKKLSEVPDSEIDRQGYFKKCIEEIDKLEYDVIAIPYKIGCGLAGGNWKIYKKILEESKTPIVLYKYEE